ncbi:MAG: hypothetical protein HOO91_06595 [Bacteroidales bacterium]|nr:hypothetical protein [Bacteroidales bacterium]
MKNLTILVVLLFYSTVVCGQNSYIKPCMDKAETVFKKGAYNEAYNYYDECLINAPEIDIQYIKNKQSESANCRDQLQSADNLFKMKFYKEALISYTELYKKSPESQYLISRIIECYANTSKNSRSEQNSKLSDAYRDSLSKQQVELLKDILLQMKQQSESSHLKVKQNMDSILTRIDYAEKKRSDSLQVKLDSILKEVKKPILTPNKSSFSYRAIFPGVAQIYKGHKVRGRFIIAGESILIGGICVSEVLRKRYDRNFYETHNSYLKDQYEKNAKNCETIRNLSTFGASLLYIISFIDGWLLPEQSHIQKNGTSLNLLPYASSYGNGLTLSLTF